MEINIYRHKYRNEQDHIIRDRWMLEDNPKDAPFPSNMITERVKVKIPDTWKIKKAPGTGYPNARHLVDEIGHLVLIKRITRINNNTSELRAIGTLNGVKKGIVLEVLEEEEIFDYY